MVDRIAREMAMMAARQAQTGGVSTSAIRDIVNSMIESGEITTPADSPSDFDTIVECTEAGLITPCTDADGAFFTDGDGKIFVL